MALQIRRGLHADLPSSPADGELLYATDTKRLYVGLGGVAQDVELYNQSGMATNGFTGNGSTVAFAISNVITSKNNLLVFVEGVFQQQDAYSIATAGGVTTVTLDSAPSSGQSILIYSIVNAVSGTNLNNDTMTGNGSTTTMTLSIAPSHENNTQVYVDGVYQPKSTYSVSGTTLTFSQAPLNGSIVEAMTMNQTEVTSGSNFTVDSMTGDGSDATLTLSNAPASENNVQVYVDGVYQPKSTYSISGTTLTFSQAPLSGSSVEAISVTPTTINVPADGSVTSAKLSGGLTMPSSLTLGGNLDVSGHDIVTTSNGAIDLDPHGSGVVTFKGNSTRGAGQFKLNCENNSHGITIKGPPHSAAASYTLTLPNTDGNADQVLKTNGSGVLDWVDQSSGGGGGMWAQVATQTISSEVHSLEFTSLGSYDEYEIRITNFEIGSNSTWGTYPQLSVIFDYGSGYVTSNYTYRSQYFPHSGSQGFYGQNNTNIPYPELTRARLNTSVSSPYPPAFGKIGWTGVGSHFFSEIYHHRTEEGHQGITWLHYTGSNTSNRQTAPTKVKFVMINGNSPITSTSEGMVSGKFTLYGRSAS